MKTILSYLILAFFAVVIAAQATPATASSLPAKSWYGMSRDDISKQGADLIVELKALIGETPEDTKTNLVAYMNRAPAIDRLWSNVYVFNRIYFDVPDKLLVKEQCFVMWEHGGELGRQKTEDELISGIYPLARIKGKLYLSGVFHSWKGGGGYPVIEEFECFLKKYKLRDSAEYTY